MRLSDLPPMRDLSCLTTAETDAYREGIRDGWAGRHPDGPPAPPIIHISWATYHDMQTRLAAAEAALRPSGGSGDVKALAAELRQWLKTERDHPYERRLSQSQEQILEAAAALTARLAAQEAA